KVGGNDAYTDGQSIQLPAIRESYPNMDIVWGYLAHEAAHIKFTDFAHHGCSALEHSLVNALEDCRIEKEMINVYPGTFHTLDALDRYLIDDGAHGVAKQDDPAGIVITACLYWGMLHVTKKTAFADLASKSFDALRDGLGHKAADQIRTLLQNQFDQATSTIDIVLL